MARPARAMSDEIEDLDGEEIDREDGIDFEPPDDRAHEVPGRKPDLKRYMLPLAGVAMVGALVAVAWMSFSPRHGAAPPDRAALDLPQPVSATLERPSRDRAIRPAGNDSDPRLGSGAPAAAAEPPRAADPAEPMPRAAASTTTGTDGMGRLRGAIAETGATDGSEIEDRLERVEGSLQTLQRTLDSLRAELTMARTPARSPESPAVVERRIKPRRQSTTRDTELARLRQETPVTGSRSSDVKAQSQRSGLRPGLQGWEIVGLSARNAALRDPSGRTHVVAIGETIVDDVELTRIDPVANRITTSAGEVAYHGGASEHSASDWPHRGEN